MTQTNFVLCVDVDDTLGMYGRGIREHIAVAEGIDPADLAEAYSWDFKEWAPYVNGRESFLAYHEDAVVNQRMLRNLQVYENASEVLWRLSDRGVWIRIVTHRLLIKRQHQIVGGDTMAWLDEHNIPYNDLFFTGAKEEVGGDLFIDDAPHNIENLRRARKDVVVFTQPHNLGIGGLRADNWLDVERIVLDRLQGRGIG